MDTSNLYEFAVKNNITIDFFPLEETKSVCINLDNKNFVALDPTVLSSQAQERVCLAHELGHCETASFYNVYSPLDIRQKHENRANKWAITQLVPLNQLEEKLKNGYTDITSLAECFSVTEEFMSKAIKFYLQK